VKPTRLRPDFKHKMETGIEPNSCLWYLLETGIELEARVQSLELVKPESFSLGFLFDRLKSEIYNNPQP
jgi:hypothetical protein